MEEAAAAAASSRLEHERERWDAVASAWRRWAPAIEDWLAPATERMLELADIRPGSHVLDVACGTGGQSLRAARRVGAAGEVLAVDLSPASLAVCAEEAAAAGLANLRTQVLDVGRLEDELPDGRFDAAICRLGLMLFPDPVAALRAIRTATRPGRWTAVVVPAAPTQNPVLADPTRALRERAGVGPARVGRPGIFALSDRAVIERSFREAGHTVVRVEQVGAVLRLEDPGQAAQLLRDALPVYDQLLALLPEADRESAWAAATASLDRYQGAAGFEARTELLVVAGSSPPAG